MVRIRTATLDDIEIVVRHRCSMFRDMGHRDEAAIDAMAQAFRHWVRRKMEDDEYLAWFAVDDDGTVTAGAGLWLMDWPPHMIGPGSRRGNILNVYTNPEHRRQGFAHELMQTVLQWCEANGIRAVILHASKGGRALYEKLGFRPTNEMRIELNR